MVGKAVDRGASGREGARANKRHEIKRQSTQIQTKGNFSTAADSGQLPVQDHPRPINSVQTASPAARWQQQEEEAIEGRFRIEIKPRDAEQRGVEAGRRGEDTGAGARSDGLVAEEGRPPGAPRARRRLHPRPRPQDRYAAPSTPSTLSTHDRVWLLHSPLIRRYGGQTYRCVL